MAAISRIARPIFIVLSALFAVGVALQFFFAGLGLLGGETMEAHNGFGWMLHSLMVIILILGLLAGLPRPLLIITVVLAVVVLVQPFWVTEFRGEALGALHVLGALVIAVLSRDIAEKGMKLLRGKA